MYRLNVLIPTHDNGERRLTEERDAVFGEILACFGGYTKSPDSNGVWVDPTTGTTYEDTITPVTVFVESDIEKDRFLTLARDWAVLLRQIALTVSYSQEAYEFVPGIQDPIVAGQ